MWKVAYIRCGLLAGLFGTAGVAQAHTVGPGYVTEIWTQANGVFCTG